ncbi:rhomboid family intramembrane serine protease [Flavobacterium sp. SUN052]|uniref:rhomboid family intramembrane serine protease n=1 Tax=Flavobacterium sp. SUN052 TaxID=3002441 RepID=UPI00237D4963|nr:rhomboid family intramembrane serine protease [Flavobacterium sp. SUN052]MEC4005864.1 rhomboid family intramembrane serine protease [Flavobacterium sp. SUN052]
MEYNFLVLGLIAIVVVVSLKGFEDLAFYRKYLFHVGSIRSGEQIRMITSGFLHVDAMHLFFNMFALFSFSSVVADWFGSIYFLTIYFASLLLGSMLTLYFHKNEYNYSAVGASGAVTGIIYSAILLQPHLPINIMFIPIDIPGYIFGILYLMYSIYGMKAKNDNIGHTAHIGGAIGGYIFTLIKEPAVFVNNPLIVIGLTIPIITMFVLAKQGKL